MSLLGTSNAFGKDTWLPVAAKQYEASVGYMFDMVDANPEWRVEGRNIFGKTIIGASLGSQVVLEGGDFPAAADATFDEFKLTLNRLAHTIELSYDEFELLNSNSAAAIPVMSGKMQLGVEEITRDAVRMMWMDGSAKLARCTTTSGATVVNIQSSNGDSGSGSDIDRNRFNWLDSYRAKVDIVDSTTGVAITNGTGRTVTDVDTVNNTVTLDTAGGNVTTTTSHLIVWSGNVTSVSNAYTSQEFPGLLAAIDSTGTYLNINRASAGKSLWKSTKVTGATSGTNENLSLANLMKVLHGIARRAGRQPDANTHFACYNYGVQAAYLTYIEPAMRFENASNQNVDFAPVGFQQMLGVLGMPGRADIHASRNTMFIIDRTDSNKFSFVKPAHQVFNFLDFAPGQTGPGGIWNIKTGSVAGKYAASYQAVLTGLLSLATLKPNAHGRLTDITEQGTAF